MSKPTLVKSFIAGGVIADKRFVKFGANDGEVLQAAAATDLIIGVSLQPGGVVQGDRVDVVMGGIAEVDCAGVIARGGEMTSDANGKALAPAPAGGTNNRIGGMAMATYAANDVGEVLVVPSVKQG